MRKFLPVVLLLLCNYSSIFSQQASLKGNVADTSDNKNLQNTVVSLLRPKDSTLVKFTRADKAGNFAFNPIDSGKFIVMVTHPYLGDYFDNINVAAGEQKDLGRLNMISKSKLLAEVIVKSGSPIKIKGDTTIYTADSFKVRAGANVEELLRTLPGIQVDKEGKIIAMGERVTKVLVDGEEFFGTDPGIATKNLRADIVQEVQVFDKKSDQAEFTGIDDGVKDKTINLKLKEDKKKGYFGKIAAGGGLKDKFNNSAMLNSFEGKRKIAGYGIMSNTGQTNLDWDDALNYGGGGGGMESGQDDDGNSFIMFGGGGDDDSYSYRNGRGGIPTNWNGGLHYSNKYNDKQSVNAGYKFSKINSPSITSTFSKTFLPDTSWSTNSISRNFSSNNKHALNLTVETKLDSMNTLKWTTRGNNKTSTSSNEFNSETLSEENLFINKNNRISTSNSENNAINSTLLWKKKFKKISRTLSANVDLNWSKSKTDGLLFSRTDFYDNGNFLRFDSLDQQNLTDNESKTINAKISYTEPLIKDLYMELSYQARYLNSTSDRITNKKDGQSKYENRIDSLSNEFVFNQFENRPGLNFRINKKKYGFSFGSAVGFSQFVQKNRTTSLKRDYSYTNFFPRASFNYKIKPNVNFRVGYNGNTSAPSLDQLQPIIVNTDPLNKYIGNPNLDQSFDHNLDISFNSYNVLKQAGFFGYTNFSFTQNDFVQFSSIDSGVRTYQTVNADGNYNGSLYSNYNFKIKGTDLSLGFGPSLSISQNVDFIKDAKSANITKNLTKRYGYGGSINVRMYKKDKFQFDIGPEISWNQSKASVNSTSNINYWQIEGQGRASVTFLKKFELQTDARAQFRKKDPNFPANNNFTTWGALLTKRFFKENSFELSIGVNDILNQNRGYNRNFSSYNFTESYYNTLKRFWLVTATWNITKNGKPAGFGF